MNQNKNEKKEKSNSNEITDAKLRYMRDKDRELVKGIFRFYEVPGGRLDFVFRKYKGDPIERYSLVDGQVYSLPLGVAKHLNEGGWYPVHSYKVDEAGTPSMHIGKKVSRVGFQSLEFIDIEGLTPTGEPLIEEARMTPPGDKIVNASVI